MPGVMEQTLLKLECDAHELGEALSVAATIAPAKAAKPVLQNVLLSAKDGALEITATDLEVSLRILVERADVQGDGRLLVNASRASQIMHELAGERVTVAQDERSGCVFSTKETRFHVLSESAEDYPDVGALAKGNDKDEVLTLKSAELVDMVARTAYAAATEKTRYAINGILVDARDARLRLVATDGKRLALAERTLVSNGKGQALKKPIFAVVPTKAMVLVQKLLTAGEETIRLKLVQNELQIMTAKATLAARLIEGHFPPYEEVLPRALEKKLDLSREAFQAALRKTALLTTRESAAVRFRFAREGLDMTSRVPEVGESRVHFPLDFPYEPLEIGFNPQYIQDVLKVFECPSFVFELKGQDNAAIIREPDEVASKRGGRFVYVVMPLNLS